MIYGFTDSCGRTRFPRPLEIIGDELREGNLILGLDVVLLLMRGFDQLGKQLGAGFIHRRRAPVLALRLGEIGNQIRPLAAMRLHGAQHLRGGRQFRIVQTRGDGIDRGDMEIITFDGIQQLGDLAHAIDDLVPASAQRHATVTDLQFQVRVAPPFDHQAAVVIQAVALLVRNPGALGEQAPEQEGIQEAHLRLVDPQRQKRVQIEAAHLDILDATRFQGLGRRLVVPCHSLGANVAVIFVLDLQNLDMQLETIIHFFILMNLRKNL